VRMHKPRILTDGGPFAEHDHACAVCSLRKSVLDISNYVFQPCWQCQKDGWVIVKRRQNGKRIHWKRRSSRRTG
jgi:hypothetical protein